MPDDTLLPFSFQAFGRKTVIAASDGGCITSDAASCCRLVPNDRRGSRTGLLR
jgi:hypothetical protein